MSSLSATDGHQSALTSGVSGLALDSLPAPTTIDIPFVVVFAPKSRYRIHFDDARFAAILSPFETVRLVSLSFSVEITGQSGKIWFAACGSDNLPTTDAEWLGSPVFQRFAGNAHGDTFADYALPSSHPFGNELKATVLGNPSPRFYFKFDGGSGDSASMRGRITVHGGGRGIVPAISLVAYADNKARDSGVGSSHASQSD